MSSSNAIIEAIGLTRTFQVGSTQLHVLRGVDYLVEQGRWTCLLGASGSGKTTLLNILGALEKPTSGIIRVNGVDLSSLSRREAAHFRNCTIGFVFQAYHLLPELSMLENVMLPGLLAGQSRAVVRKRAKQLLERTGLATRLKHRPAELSGGEQQRASIARALINDPKLLLADEPTGNLDSETGKEILELFQELRADQSERTIVMITHNREIAKLANQVDELVDGVLHRI